ncbi:MAG: hypothetical protein QNI96_06250 [Woeseiaceae bacterium]|nr:hypothetical protein [Woeseiaceae bacterium]
MAIRLTPGAACAGLALLVAVTSPMPAYAGDEGVEDDSKRCINARSIRGTEVINDNYIVFEIQGRRLYLNALPKSCTGLSKNRRFSWEISTRSLCARDKIRVLREGGNTVFEGRSCSLGRFRPVTFEELMEFTQGAKRAPEPQEVEAADVEDVVTN